MKDELIKFETLRMAEDKGYWTSLDDESRRRLRGKLPTQSLLQRWLREMHRIQVTPYPTTPDRMWGIVITNMVLEPASPPGHDYPWTYLGGRKPREDYYTYESALEDGLQAALELIKSIT